MGGAASWQRTDKTAGLAGCVEPRRCTYVIELVVEKLKLHAELAARPPSDRRIRLSRFRCQVTIAAPLDP